MKIENKLICDVEPAIYKDFDCGKEWSMNLFLKEDALKYYLSGQATTNVIIDAENNQTIGYFSLKCNSFKISNIDLSNSEEIIEVIPAVEIARFAVDRNFQGKIMENDDIKYSEYIMDELMYNVQFIREYFIGIKAIILFSVNGLKQINFYKKMGFKIFNEFYDVYQSTENENCIPMYLFLTSVK